MAKSMQIKSNQDVREYKEVVYFGMTLRLGVYLLCNRRMSMEAVSWLCVAAAVPFGAFGFVRWHGMPFEQIIGVFIRSRLVLGRPLFFRPENPYKEVIISANNQKRRVMGCSKAKRS